MSEYNQYVTAINKVFYNLEKMKTGWDDLDNLNYIESVEEYKQIVVSKANEFKKNKTLHTEKLELKEDKSIENLEEK